MTSHLNEKRDFVIKESIILYNKLAGKELLEAIIESGKKKTGEKHVKQWIVLYPEEPADDVVVAEIKKGNECLNCTRQERKTFRYCISLFFKFDSDVIIAMYTILYSSPNSIQTLSLTLVTFDITLITKLYCSLR